MNRIAPDGVFVRRTYFLLRIITTFAIALALAPLAGCTGKKSKPEESKPKSVVEVVAPEKKSITDTVILTGSVEAENRSMVAPNIGGNVVAILVDVGDKVKKGQTLARLDTAALSAQRSAAEQSLAMAKIQLEIAQKGARPEQVKQLKEQAAASDTAYNAAEDNYTRQKKLFDDGVVPQSALDQALAMRDAARAAHVSLKLSLEMAQTGARAEDVELARLGVKAAGSQLALASANVGYSYVRAPFAGVVANKMIEVGEHAATTTPVFEIVGEGFRKVTVDVPATLVDQVSRAGDIKLHLGTSDMPARILKVYPSVDETTRTCKVEVTPSSDAGLIVGSFVEVRFTTALSAEVIALPRRCVQSPGENPFVWTVSKEGAVAKVPVKLGVASEQEFEIVSGLTGGERVIITGGNLVSEGDKVDARDYANGGGQE